MTTVPPPVTVTVTVDGRSVRVAGGAMLLDAVRAAGAPVADLCQPEARGPLGVCRGCLVEVEGWPRLAAACHTPVAEGLEVRTRSARCERVRRGVLDLTLGMSADGRGADGRGAGRAAHEAAAHGLERSTYAPRPRGPRDESNVFFALEMADCVLCGRCVDACQRTQHIGAIGVNGRGPDARIGVAFDAPWEQSVCTSCGQCVAQCPTGALRPKAAAVATASECGARTLQTEVVRTTCPYCGVGCGLAVHTVDGRIAWVDGEPNNDSSEGMTCVKGRFGLDFVHSPDRLTTPLVRRNGELRPASWDEALSLVAERFAAAAREPSGDGGFAAIASAKATNEDGYVLQKFARAVMATNSIDHCARLCHAPSVTAMMEQIGSGATSNSYQDYDHAGTLMVVGSDTSQNHPVIASRLRRAVERNGARLIVVNPIRIDLADVAEVFLQPRPGTDVALFNAMAQVILEEELWDRDFVEARSEGFEQWRRAVAPVTPEAAERISGVPAGEIRRAARLYARPHRNGSCLLWGMGVTQHTMGTDNARALVNLALLCGQVGGLGNGISPLRGQNNVQGCSDSGCLPNTLPGYEPLEGPALERYAAAWNADLDPAPGLQSTAMIEAMLDGSLTAMYVVGENPLLSDPYLAHAREAFEALDFLVVQDIFLHETAEIADVVLPAQSFAEKSGTFTNSERRVQLVRPIVEPPGEARPDWEITDEIARRVCAILGRPGAGFEHSSAAEIFDEMAALMPIIAGLSHARLDREGGIQWPAPDADHPGTPRLFAEEFPRGRGRFVAVEQGPAAAELPSRRFPFTLITGRSLYHWHGGGITRRVSGLLASVPVVAVDMHPDDATRLEVEDGQHVQLASRRGEIVAQVHVVERMRRGELFVPFVQLEGAAANFLTNDALDAASGIPEYKACAVRVEAVGTPSRADRGRGPGALRKRGGMGAGG